MTISIELKPDVEAFIARQAALRGLSAEAYLNSVLENLSAQTTDKEHLSSEEWAREFRAWAASHSPVTTVVQDSRDSIYQGRGE